MRKIFVLLLLAAAAAADAQSPYLGPISRRSFGVQNAVLDDVCVRAATADDGVTTLFMTNATNVGVGPQGSAASGLLTNIFVRDAATGQVDWIGSAPATGANFGHTTHLSGNGRYVLFAGPTSNMPSIPQSGDAQVFVVDRVAQTIELITRDANGNPFTGTNCAADAISADGRYVCFSTGAPNVPGSPWTITQIYRYDRQTGIYAPVVESATVTPGVNFNIGLVATMTPDGRFISFWSLTDGLVPGDVNQKTDLYLRDMTSPTLELVSVSTSGVQGNANSSRIGGISNDGRFVVFNSSASNLDDQATCVGGAYYVRDRRNGTTRVLAAAPGGAYARFSGQEQTPPAIQGVSHRVFYASSVPLSTNLFFPANIRQIWMTDIDNGATALVSVGASAPANGDCLGVVLSPNGEHLSFHSGAANLVNDGITIGGAYQLDIPCSMTADMIGTGTPGAGGLTPLVFGTPTLCAGISTIYIAGGLGGASLLLLAGDPLAQPGTIGTAPLYVDLLRPHVIAQVPNYGLPGIFGAGSFTLQANFSFIPGDSMMLQAFFIDPFVPAGFSSTNGLLLQIR